MGLLDFARGPGKSLTACVLGRLRRLFAVLRPPAMTEQSPPRDAAPSRTNATLGAVARGFWPHPECGAAARVATVNGHVMQVGLALIAVGCALHITFIRRVTGIGWPALPDAVMRSGLGCHDHLAAAGAVAAPRRPGASPHQQRRHPPQLAAGVPLRQADACRAFRLLALRHRHPFQPPWGADMSAVTAMAPAVTPAAFERQGDAADTVRFEAAMRGLATDFGRTAALHLKACVHCRRCAPPLRPAPSRRAEGGRAGRAARLQNRGVTGYCCGGGGGGVVLNPTPRRCGRKSS